MVTFQVKLPIQENINYIYLAFSYAKNMVLFNHHSFVQKSCKCGVKITTQVYLTLKLVLNY